MKLYHSTPDIDEAPWYIAGLAFECQACGRCCAGPEEGYVWATDEEIAKMAEHMDLSEKDFRKKYVRKIGRRQSLVEQKVTHDCIFLKNGKCSMYEVRPMQCRTWPFWTSNIATPENWAMAGMRCVGINRGKLFTPEEIQARAHNTRE